MENKDEIQELSLDDILTEFQEGTQEEAENVELGEELTSLLETLPSVEQMRSTAEQAAQDAAEAEKALEGQTLRLCCAPVWGCLSVEVKETAPCSL